MDLAVLYIYLLAFIELNPGFELFFSVKYCSLTQQSRFRVSNYDNCHTYSIWVTLIVQLLVGRVVPTAVVPRSIDNSLHWSLESTYTGNKNHF